MSFSEGQEWGAFDECEALGGCGKCVSSFRTCIVKPGGLSSLTAAATGAGVAAVSESILGRLDCVADSLLCLRQVAVALGASAGDGVASLSRKSCQYGESSVSVGFIVCYAHLLADALLALC